MKVWTVRAWCLSLSFLGVFPSFADFRPLTNYCALENIAQAVGEVTEVEKVDGSFAYTLVYFVSESTAFGQDGKKIEGPLTQSIFTHQGKKKPLLGQKIKLRYCQDEPIFFEYLDPVKFEAPQSSKKRH